MSGARTPSRRLSSTTTRVTPRQPPKSLLMQLGPDPRTGMKHQQANRLAAVAQRHHEHPGSPVFARGWVAHHRPLAVIDLALFAGGCFDHHTSFWRLAPAELADETLHALIRPGKAVAIHQIPPNRLGIATATHGRFDRVSIRFASADRRTATGFRDRRVCRFAAATKIGREHV